MLEDLLCWKIPKHFKIVILRLKNIAFTYKLCHA